MALIIRHYDNPHSAEEALSVLHAAGIGEGQIGFLTRQGVRGTFHVPPEMNPDDMSGAEGAALGTLAGMVAAVAAMATPFGPIVAAGPLFGTLIGALAGAATGGAVASLVDAGASKEVARRLTATLENDDAVLLSIEVPDEREEEIVAMLARSDQLHEDEWRYFETYHLTHQESDFESFSDAYHFGYRTAAERRRPFEAAEPYLRAQYEGDFDQDREPIQVGYQRYLDTVLVLSQE